jgi:predicted AAA+ superfamily ATPase
MYIERDLEPFIMSGIKQAPILAVIGPRQSGKSTLLKKLFKEYRYLDMQDAELMEFANTDPKGFLHQYSNEKGVIFDEVQYAPKLFSQLKVEVDQNPRPGYYILSGSQNFLLYEKISESLAGRVYFYTLLPLSIKELTTAALIEKRPSTQIYKGFYPKIYQPHIDHTQYYQNYISTYIERDIRSIKNIDNMIIFKKFMQLCALRIGTTLNYTDLAVSCGITVITVKSWLSLLETSFVLYLLPPYHTNLGKRLIKAPKLYFYDVGVATALLGIDQKVLTSKRDLYGSLFENMIVMDLLKYFNNQKKTMYYSFFRDTNQKEIDLIIETEGKTIPIEIKASETFNAHFLDTLHWFQGQTKNKDKAILIYGGSAVQTIKNVSIVPWYYLGNNNFYL